MILSSRKVSDTCVDRNRLLFVDNIKSLCFTSWWIEQGEKNLIQVVYRLDGEPHEIVIKDTKYYVKEIYSADLRNSQQLQVSAPYID
jgi:hypothetical protein